MQRNCFCKLQATALSVKESTIKLLEYKKVKEYYQK